MKKIIALLLAMSGPVFGSGVFMMDNVAPSQNARVVLASTTATQILLTNPLNRNLVVVNDDMENAVFYGDSTCTFQLGQKINPGEKVMFQGVTAGFNFYVCTEYGSAEVRLVEH